jgi:hypothetical protein
MKRIFFLLFTAIAFTAQAQTSFSENSMGAIKSGAGYVHDFPGLNGAGAFVEYSFPLNEWLQGGVGIKRIQTAGYPRTQTVKEYTKATTLDFNLLFVPFHTENSAFRIGAGYSFSFYNIRRSFAVYGVHTESPSTSGPSSWLVQDGKGRVNGPSLMAEYEYYFENRFSMGARIMLGKAYINNVVLGGPFVSVRF